MQNRMYLIGRAAQLAGISPETARAYCRQGLLSPIRDSAGRRLFTEADVQRLREIFKRNADHRHSYAVDADPGGG
jgi:MerR family transcriptional regulator, heat shock protein HspR